MHKAEFRPELFHERRVIGGGVETDQRPARDVSEIEVVPQEAVASFAQMVG